ncbi:MAG: hypothetical protein N2169_03060 [bacterium]|nr:hypothetical protein [bacterium]
MIQDIQIIKFWPFQITQLVHIGWFTITLLLIYFYISFTLYYVFVKLPFFTLSNRKSKDTYIEIISKNKNLESIIAIIILLVFILIAIYSLFGIIYNLTKIVYNDFNKKFSRTINKELLKNGILIDNFYIAKYIPQESNFFKNYLHQKDFSKYEINEYNSLIILYIKDKQQPPIYFSELNISEKTRRYVETFYYGCIFSIHETIFYPKDKYYMKFNGNNKYHIIMYQYNYPDKSLLEYKLFRIINPNITLDKFNKILQIIKSFVI